MRHLYLLRGVPGVGKSTMLAKMNLEQFTINVDAVRQLYANTDYAIRYDEKGEPIVQETISPNVESLVWETVHAMLEKRMERGDTTIIDATHSTPLALKDYNKLVNKYKYRIFTVQINRPLEDIIESNNQRVESKRVKVEDVVRKYNQIQATTPNIPKRYNLHQFDTIEDAGEFILSNSTWRTKEITVSDFKKVFLIGDIHATYETLAQFLEEHYSDDNYYVFMGDYLDRGLKPYETIKALHAIKDNDNVVFLRGNHETNYENWLSIPKRYTEEMIKSSKKITDKMVANNKADIKRYKKLTRSSIKYINELKAQVSDKEFADFTDKVKGLLNRTQDIFMFSVNGQKYVCTHGGIVYNALDYNNTGSTINLSSYNMVRGVGSYDDDIDAIFNKQMLALPEEERVIQVHGHRNKAEVGIMDNPYSYNLEQGITDGGLMGVLEIDVATGKVNDISIQNNHYRMTLQNTDLSVYPVSKLYEDMKNNEYIKVKELKTVDGVYSINFSEDAFYEKKWNDMTVRARGLFVNPEEEKVVARSYNKFFNINERKATNFKDLDKNVVLPVKISSKVNGFLGILTVYKGEFLFLSKSTDGSTFSKMFKDTFLAHALELGIDLDGVKRFIEQNDVSLVFEVINMEEDPHIIEYENSGVVLLDVFKNQLVEETLNKREIPELAMFIMPEEIVIDDMDELKQYINDFSKGVDVRTTPVLEGVGESLNSYNEGFILTDALGFRIKVKGKYYNTWKSIRPIIYQRLAGKRGNARDKFGQEFLGFLMKNRNDELTNSVINERLEYVKWYDENYR